MSALSFVQSTLDLNYHKRPPPYLVVDQSPSLHTQTLIQSMANLDGRDSPPSDTYISTPEFSTPPGNRVGGDPFLASKLGFFIVRPCTDKFF